MSGEIIGRRILGDSESRSEISENLGNVQSMYLNSEPIPEAYGVDVDVDVDSTSYVLREINIRPLNSGYLVNVGCQSVAVETTETLLKALGEYLNNPRDFEKNGIITQTETNCKNKLKNTCII